MSKYTTTIKNLIDNNFNFGLQDYPIFNESYREKLNNNILNHYYENEIGQETAGLFKFFLNQRMNEIMPYYNTLYQAQETTLTDLFNNVNLTETSNRENTNSTNSSSSSNSNNKNLFQDTPQGKLDFTELENQNWATNYTMNKGIINDNSTSSGNNKEDFTKIIKGSNGNKYKIEILENVKNNLMNIDLMIINDLNDLFMQIF